MNANQIINMILRMVMRKAVNKGLDAGINKVAGGGKARDEMSPEERQQARSGKQAAKRTRQTMKMARRIGRM